MTASFAFAVSLSRFPACAPRSAETKGTRARARWYVRLSAQLCARAWRDERSVRVPFLLLVFSPAAKLPFVRGMPLAPLFAFQVRSLLPSSHLPPSSKRVSVSLPLPDGGNNDALQSQHPLAHGLYPSVLPFILDLLLRPRDARPRFRHHFSRSRRRVLGSDEQPLRPAVRPVADRFEEVQRPRDGGVARCVSPFFVDLAGGGRRS